MTNIQKRRHLSLVFFLCAIFAGCSSHRKEIREAQSHSAESIWDFPLHPSPALSREEGIRRLTAAYHQVSTQLLSWEPDNEVRIPFQEKNGQIYVQTEWNDKTLTCMVDTGSEAITWPQWLHLDTEQLNIPGLSYWQGGSVTRDEWVKTQKIKIGSYVLYNVPTCAIGVAKSYAPGTGIAEVVLGNKAFRPNVLTIDYRTHELIVRRKTYDITRRPLAAETHLLNFISNKFGGDIILQGTLMGHSARFALDTGSSFIVVSPSFLQKYLSRLPRTKFKRGVSFSSTLVDKVENLSGSFGSGTFHTKVALIAPIANNSDVIVGEPLLRQYRITIDYPRHKVILERSTDKTSP